MGLPSCAPAALERGFRRRAHELHAQMRHAQHQFPLRGPGRRSRGNTGPGPARRRSGRDGRPGARHRPADARAGRWVRAAAARCRSRSRPVSRYCAISRVSRAREKPVDFRRQARSMPRPARHRRSQGKRRSASRMRPQASARDAGSKSCASAPWATAGRSAGLLARRISSFTIMPP